MMTIQHFYLFCHWSGLHVVRQHDRFLISSPIAHFLSSQTKKLFFDGILAIKNTHALHVDLAPPPVAPLLFLLVTDCSNLCATLEMIAICSMDFASLLESGFCECSRCCSRLRLVMPL
jgi:hypothetical protein